MFDGTFKKAGEHAEQYTLEMDNGAKAIVRSFGGNAFSYITKDGVEVCILINSVSQLVSYPCSLSRF
jgi:hypothetical protein